MNAVAIIGGGISGLTTAKSMLDVGLCPVIFEQAESIGGLWRSPKKGFVWKNMKTNLSIRSMSLSDHPWPAGSDFFPQQDKVRDYLNSFAQKFLQAVDIRLETEVLSLKRHGEFWLIEHRSTKMGIKKEHFQFCVVASGVFAKPNWPRLENLSNFKRVLHSGQYSNPGEFLGDRVLIVGSSYTGVGIATDLVGHAKSVSIACSSNGAYFIPLYLAGKPWDSVYWNQAAHRREMSNKDKHAMMRPFQVKGMECLRPKHSLPPYVIPSHGDFRKNLRHGRIKAYPRLVAVERNSSRVVFKDGTKAEFDTIILATGYKVNLSFLSEGLKRKIIYRENDVFLPTILYRSVWPDETENLGFVGMYRAPYFATIELQGRWCAKVFSKQLPPPKKMKITKGLEEVLEIRHSKCKDANPFPDYVKFSNEIAREIGEYPSHILDNSRHKYHKFLLKSPTQPVHYRSDLLDGWLKSKFRSKAQKIPKILPHKIPSSNTSISKL